MQILNAGLGNSTRAESEYKEPFDRTDNEMFSLREGLELYL